MGQAVQVQAVAALVLLPAGIVLVTEAQAADGFISATVAHVRISLLITVALGVIAVLCVLCGGLLRGRSPLPTRGCHDPVY